MRNELNFTFTTNISGRILRADRDRVVIENRTGRYMLHTNLSTRLFKRLPGEPCQQATHDELAGALATGVVIVDPRSGNRMVCTKLIVLAEGVDSVQIERPQYWIDYVARIQGFWAQHAVDNEYGGYFTYLDRFGHCPRSDKVTYVVSRTLYGFCVAFALTGDPQFLRLADLGVEFQLRALRRRAGWLVWETRLKRDGGVNADNPSGYNIFTQVYALTGLVAYYAITRSAAVRQVIEEAVASLEELFLDPEYGGFYDAIDTRTLRPLAGRTDTKSFNSTVDVATSSLLPYLEAHTSPPAHVSKLVRHLVQLVLEHFVDRRTGWIREVFSRDWQFTNLPVANPYSTPDKNVGIVGSNTKTAWLLLRSLELLQESDRERARRTAGAILQSMTSRGYDGFRWGWFDVLTRDSGEFVWHQHKSWWEQEEGILSNMLFHLLSGDEGHRAIAREGMLFWYEYFIDHVYGGVFDTVDANGVPVNSAKGHNLKGAYHETELAYYLYFYLSHLNASPLRLFAYGGPIEAPADYEMCPTIVPGSRMIRTAFERSDGPFLRLEYAFRVTHEPEPASFETRDTPVT